MPRDPSVFGERMDPVFFMLGTGEACRKDAFRDAKMTSFRDAKMTSFRIAKMAYLGTLKFTRMARSSPNSITYFGLDR